MRQKETESAKMYHEMEKRRKEYAKGVQRGNPPPQIRAPSDTPTTATVRRKTTQAMSTGHNGRQQSVAAKGTHTVHTSSQGPDNKHSKKSATSGNSGTQGSVAMKTEGKASGSKKETIYESSGKSTAWREGATEKHSGKSAASNQNGLGMGGPSESKHKAKFPEKTVGSSGQPIAFSHLMKLATGNVEEKQDSKVKRKPPTESTVVSGKASTQSQSKDKSTVQTKKRDLGKSTGTSESGLSKRQALGKSTGTSASGPSKKLGLDDSTQNRSSSAKHHVTPTFKVPQSKEKAGMHTGRGPSSKGSSQPRPHPSMKSLSFYHAKAAGTGGRPSPGLGHQRLSGSWLDQLGYSIAELQRKRKQQELDEFEDDDDMYDDDDGFVVDDEVAAEDVDVSATIKELFGYDRKR